MSDERTTSAVPSHFFNRITFSIPVESFKIEYDVTEDKRESVVTEFVLRLLWVAGSVDVLTLKSYFGFSDSEAIIVIDDLKNKGLIELFDSKITLTAHSKIAFAASNADYPSFVKVESRADQITFDLLSFSPMQNRKGGGTQNGITLQITQEIQGKSIELAKNAFHNKFEDCISILSDTRKKTSLYSLNDIESRRRSFINIPVVFALDQHGNIERIIESKAEVHISDEFMDLFNEKVSLELGVSVRNSGVEELESFINIFKCPFLENYISGNKFNFSKFMSDVDSKNIEKPTGIVPVYGAMYFPHNLEKIIDRIELRRNKNEEKRKCSSLIWISPDDKFWGRGDLLEQSFAKLNASLQINGSDNTYLFTRANPGDEAVISNRFRGSHIKEVHLYKPIITEGTGLLQNLEILFYPGGFMSVLLHLSSNENPSLKIPIGFISNKLSHLKYCQNFLNPIINSSRYLGRASFNNKNSILPVNTSEVFNFINTDNLEDTDLSE